MILFCGTLRVYVKMMNVQSFASNLESQDIIGQMISCAIRHYNGVLSLQYAPESLPDLFSFQNTVSIFFVEGNVMLVTSAENNFESVLHFMIRYLRLKCSDALLDYSKKKLANGTFGDAMNALCAANIFEKQKAFEALKMYNIIHTEKYDSLAIYSVNTSKECEYTSSGDGDWCLPVDMLRHTVVLRRNSWAKASSTLGKNEIIKPIMAQMREVSHEPTVRHINTYHGSANNSILDVAIQLGHDPLAILPQYIQWINQRLVAPLRSGTDLPKKLELPCILVVDDSPIVQSMMRRTLSEEFNIVCATDAMEALGVLNNQRVDLIITDVTMPDIDGMEFCRTVRKINKFKNLPIIMLTSKEGILDYTMGKLAGATRYLGKSASKDEILKAIKECI